MEQLQIEKYKGFYCRPNTSDKKMVKESLANYAKFNIDHNSIVVDFGGNIGAFGKMALEANCKQLHIFEPETSNFNMITLNLLDYNRVEEKVKFYQTAVSTSDKPELIFYQNNSGNKDCSGTVAPSSKRSIAARKIRTVVANKNINEVIAELKPTHLKIDIEGAEIDWIKQTEANIPDSVQELALEIHKDNTGFFEEFDSIWYPKICEKFEPIFIHPNSGFKDENKITLPNMGIEVYGSLFGIDLLFRRKI